MLKTSLFIVDKKACATDTISVRKILAHRCQRGAKKQILGLGESLMGNASYLRFHRASASRAKKRDSKCKLAWDKAAKSPGRNVPLSIEEYKRFGSVKGLFMPIEKWISCAMRGLP